MISLQDRPPSISSLTPPPSRPITFPVRGETFESRGRKTMIIGSKVTTAICGRWISCHCLSHRDFQPCFTAGASTSWSVRGLMNTQPGRLRLGF